MEPATALRRLGAAQGGGVLWVLCETIIIFFSGTPELFQEARLQRGV